MNKTTLKKKNCFLTKSNKNKSAYNRTIMPSYEAKESHRHKQYKQSDPKRQNENTRKELL